MSQEELSLTLFKNQHTFASKLSKSDGKSLKGSKHEPYLNANLL